MAAAVSYVMYSLAVVLLPIFLAIFLAFALYPLANTIGKVKVGQGTIHLSRVVAIILAFFTLGFVVLIGVGFVLLPLFGEINSLLVKMPDVLRANKSGIEEILQNPSAFPVLPSSFGMLLDDIVSWAMGFVAGIAHLRYNNAAQQHAMGYQVGGHAPRVPLARCLGGFFDGM